jgi:hypothetical protein
VQHFAGADGPTDMRRGFDGLAVLRKLGEDSEPAKR